MCWASLRLGLIKSTKPYREGLQEIIETERPPIRAIFMGTRYTDPSCGAPPTLSLSLAQQRFSLVELCD
jgi:hypothetical protein